MTYRKLVLMLIALFVLALPVTVMAGTVDLPRTGQTTCTDTAGNVVACSGTGQDGDIRAGVSWPSNRFTISTDGYCVTDNLTGLMWVRSPDSVQRTWQQSLDYANGLSLCGYTDWRLSNVLELESLINAEESNTALWLNMHGFSNVQSDDYWSSTPYSNDPAHVWVVNMFVGFMSNGNGPTTHYAWPVRTRLTGVAKLWATGQKTCYDSSGRVIVCTGTGQDGDIRAGSAWPSPRYTVSTDGYCVTDNLTGLMWVRSPDSVQRTWQQAVNYSNGLSLCGYTDWRLPNREELHSLTDFSQYNPALQSGHPFLNVQSYPNFYWSSTSLAIGPTIAWGVEMWGGITDYDYKSGFQFVWPVRSGQAVQTWFEEADPAITYTGTWNSLVCNPCNNGFLKYSGQTGAKAEFSFYGTGIKWTTAKAPALGKAKIYFDGAYKGMVDLYRSTVQYPLVLGGSGIPPGNHTLTIEVSGQKNAGSSGYYTLIDAFEVIP